MMDDNSVVASCRNSSTMMVSRLAGRLFGRRTGRDVETQRLGATTCKAFSVFCLQSTMPKLGTADVYC